MLKNIAIVLAALVATSAAAQTAARPDPADPRAGAPLRPEYESAFKDYRRYNDTEKVRWREANQEMGRLNGHVGHVPGSVPQAGAPSSTKPPAHMHHGGQGGRK